MILPGVLRATLHRSSLPHQTQPRNGLAPCETRHFFAYADNYLIDMKHGVVMDVEAPRAIRQAEVRAPRTMIERTEVRFGIKPQWLAAYCRKMVKGLRTRSLDGDADEREAVQLVRGFVRRVVVLPRDEDEPQGLEIEAGSVSNETKTDYDCNVGCGGSHPLLL